MLKITFVWEYVDIEFSVVVKKIEYLTAIEDGLEYVEMIVNKSDVLGYSDESLLKHFTRKSKDENKYKFYGISAKVESIF